MRKSDSFRIGGSHVYIGKGLVYCQKVKDSAAPVTTYSRVKCSLCGKTIQSASNPAYIGLKKNGTREYFFSKKRVTKLTHGDKYGAVVGPFRSKKEAWKRGGYANPPAEALREAGSSLIKKFGYTPEDARGVVRKVMTYGLSRLGEQDRGDLLLALKMSGRKNPPFKITWTKNNTDLETWFERDRAHVELKTKPGKTIVEWWDDSVSEAVTDGFLDPRDYHGSAVKYANSLGLLPRKARRNPPGKNSPVHIYGETEKIFMRKTRGPYKGKNFVHEFKGGVEQTGFPRGTIVRSPDGREFRMTTRSVILSGKKDLWRNFPA